VSSHDTSCSRAAVDLPEAGGPVRRSFKLPLYDLLQRRSISKLELPAEASDRS